MKATVYSLLVTGMIGAAALLTAVSFVNLYEREGWSLVLDTERDSYVLDYGMSLDDCYDAMMQVRGSACERN